jgi:hypothetical protein
MGGTNGSGSNNAVFALVMLGTVLAFVAAAISVFAFDNKDAVILVPALFAALALTLPIIATFLTALNTARVAADAAQAIAATNVQVASVATRVDTVATRVDGVVDKLVASAKAEGAASATVASNTARREDAAALALVTASDKQGVRDDAASLAAINAGALSAAQQSMPVRPTGWGVADDRAQLPSEPSAPSAPLAPTVSISEPTVIVPTPKKGAEQ